MHTNLATIKYITETYPNLIADRQFPNNVAVLQTLVPGTLFWRVSASFFKPLDSWRDEEYKVSHIDTKFNQTAIFFNKGKHDYFLLSDIQCHLPIGVFTDYMQADIFSKACVLAYAQDRKWQEFHTALKRQLHEDMQFITRNERTRHWIQRL